jgi:hypothetical protein
VALDEYPFGKRLNLTAACRNLHLAVPTLGPTTREYYTFTTKLDLKNQCLINYKTAFGTRNPAFWVGAVVRSAFFFVKRV